MAVMPLRPVPVLAPLLLLTGLAVVLTMGARAHAPAQRAAPAGWPALFAWTWNRNEDLRFLPPGAGVAAVRISIELEGSRVRTRANNGTWVAPAAAFVLPVVHVDAFERWHPVLDAQQEDALVATIVAVGKGSPSGALQVDFEALPSQRQFYRRVLTRVRAALPSAWISITALASWCLDDRWTAGLPVDDVVAMAFRLGRDGPVNSHYISALERWPAANCSSTGIATDEPGLRPPAHRALFLFSPRPWTAAAWQATWTPLTSERPE